MHIIDLPNPERINRIPDKSSVLFSEKNYSEHGFRIKKVELRQYILNTDAKLGPYSLITSYVETDKGSIEMTYEEDYLGDDSLTKTSDFLAKNLGISGLILRSIISLKEEIKKSHS